MVNSNTQSQRLREYRAMQNEYRRTRNAQRKANIKRKLETHLENLTGPVPKGYNMRLESNRLKAAANAGRTRKSRKSRGSTRRRR